MKIRLMILLVLAAWHAGAQTTSNVVLFSNDGEKFTAILNGLRMNDDPATQVRLDDLKGEFFKLKVIFADAALGEESFNLNISMAQGQETTCQIKRNKNGKYVLRYTGSVPIDHSRAAATPAPEPHAAPAPAPSAGSVQQETVTTTTSTAGGDNMNINMGVSMGDQGASVHVDMSGMDGSSTVHGTSTHTTTTVTQTTTSTTTSAPLPPPTTPSPAPVYLPGYTGPVGCPTPLSPKEFNDLKRSINSKTFEESKMTIAKQVVSNACLFAGQVRELMQLFTFENSRLDLAKVAYDHTYDIGNYYKVNDAFTFESSIDELNEYIESRR